MRIGTRPSSFALTLAASTLVALEGDGDRDDTDARADGGAGSFDDCAPEAAARPAEAGAPDVPGVLTTAADEAGRRLLVHAASRPATATKIVKERKRRDV
jgi:hypothetical protein